MCPASTRATWIECPTTESCRLPRDPDRLASGATATTRLRTAPAVFELRLQLQPPQRIAPHPFERRGHGAERTAPRLVEAPAVLAPAVHQTRIAQRPKLQRDRPEGDIRHGGMDFSGAKLLLPDQPQDLPPAGRSDSAQNGRLEQHSINLDKTKMKVKSEALSSQLPALSFTAGHRSSQGAAGAPKI